MIDPILRDRITVIKTNPLTINEKIIIVKNYMLPEILKDVGFGADEILIEDINIKYIVETYTIEAGVRKLKECVFEIVREINLLKMKGNEIKIPFTIGLEYIKDIFDDRQKVRHKEIHDKPRVGWVNGLYATNVGIGGITPIQIIKYSSEKFLDLTITGNQGDTMKESIQYALRIAFSLLPEEKQKQYLEESKNKKNFGLHVHATDAATKKDGPSAGGAITLAIYSILANIPINNEIALTGEIDLARNITAIGGLDAKLNGAKKAGIKKALIPKENDEDLRILIKDEILKLDDTFEVVTVETIEEILEHALVK